MSFTNSPLQLDPVRTNILKEPQIRKEIYSLENHIKTLESSIDSLNNQIDHALPKQIVKEPVKRVSDKVITSDVYHINGKLPMRFEEPDLWKYDVKKQHPLYTTTTNTYGSQPPTVHDMPSTFQGQTSKFSSVTIFCFN
ncbi:hypothetical protein HDV02_000283 [Globomyces sp. JEL0801]|nr:hypothetical protein HDV02_000283 [Globomyces sp. JEL0801]